MDYLAASNDGYHTQIVEGEMIMTISVDVYQLFTVVIGVIITMAGILAAVVVFSGMFVNFTRRL